MARRTPGSPAQPYIPSFRVVDPPEAADRSGDAERHGGGNPCARVSRSEAAEDGLTAVSGSETVPIGGAGRSEDDVSDGALDRAIPSSVETPASDRFFDAGDPDLATEDGFERGCLDVASRSHAGGAWAFGPDGALHVSLGDGTSSDFADPRTVDGQDTDRLAGEALRVDPITGREPPDDDPFAGDDRDLDTAEVRRLGLRDPRSMGFDPMGRLFVAETG